MTRSPTLKLRLTIAAQVKPVVCLSQQRNVNQCFRKCRGSTRMLIVNPAEISPVIWITPMSPHRGPAVFARGPKAEMNGAELPFALARR
jgi:hypothetical protein